MTSLSDTLRALASRCRHWAGQVMELGAAKDLRNVASVLDQKAQECAGVDCPSASMSSNGALLTKNE
jgi:hypothetical protein